MSILNSQFTYSATMVAAAITSDVLGCHEGVTTVCFVFALLPFFFTVSISKG